MPENNANQQNTRNVPFEVIYAKAKANVVASINKIAKDSDLPLAILVTILREIAMENDLNAKSNMLSYYELVTPEEYSDLIQAKSAMTQILENQKQETKTVKQNETKPVATNKD